MRLINCIFALSSGGSTLRVSAHNRKRNRNRMGEEANFKYASINSINRKRECVSSEMHNLASWKREMHCCSKWEFWSLWGWWACYFPTSPIWFICTSADLSGALVSCRKLGICQVWTGLSSSTFYYFFFFVFCHWRRRLVCSELALPVKGNSQFIPTSFGGQATSFVME